MDTRTDQSRLEGPSSTAIRTPAARYASRRLDRLTLALETTQPRTGRRRWLQLQRSAIERAFVPKVEVAR